MSEAIGVRCPAGYAEFAQAFKRILHVHDSRDKYVSHRAAHAYAKYLICHALDPVSIVEIGVRAGYSAWAFLLACPLARYVGFDIYGGSEPHGGFHDGGMAKAHAEFILRGKSAEVHTMDSQLPEFIPPPAVFYHVDGNHSKEGCDNDVHKCLEAAKAEAGVVLVDDFDYKKEVKASVTEALSTLPGLKGVHVKSWRGEVLLSRNANKLIEVSLKLEAYGLEPAQL